MNQYSNYIFPILFFLSVIIFTETLRKITNSKSGLYKARKYLLTVAEKEFYHYILKIIPNGFALMTKIRVEDIVSAAKDRNYIFARNKIRAKHVDFLIMEQATGEIKGVIELNDNSHLRIDRQERDRFLEQVFTSCEIPILWVNVSKYYASNRKINHYVCRITES